MEKGFYPQIRKKFLKIATLKAGIRSISAVYRYPSQESEI